jgi:hypothetical protein
MGSRPSNLVARGLYTDHCFGQPPQLPPMEPIREHVEEMGRAYIKAKAWAILGWLLDWVIPPEFSIGWLGICILVALFTTVVFYALMHGTKPLFVRFVTWLMSVILTSGLDFFIGLATFAVFATFVAVLLHYEASATSSWISLLASIGRNGTIPVSPK